METKALRQDIEALVDDLGHIERRIQHLVDSIVGAEPCDPPAETLNRGNLKAITETCLGSAVRIKELVSRLETELLPEGETVAAAPMMAQAG